MSQKKSQNKFLTPDLSLSEFCKGQFWPIHPPAFEDMYRRLGIENASGGLAQFAVGRPQKTAEKDLYSLYGDTAVISISGPLMKRESFSLSFFGGTSYAYIQTAVKAALADDEVAALALRVDSPGGVVNGLDETADLIFNSRGSKPIVAYADGMMASAAYEIGSAADEIVAGATSMVGSIGVLMVHEDWSAYNQKNGVEVTYMTAGKYKALGNPDEPLSDLARETFQAELNYLYTLFVNTVARNRDVEESKVLTDMADGRIFIGLQAVDAGLVDHVGNFDLAFERAADLASGGKLNNLMKIRSSNMANEKESKITLEMLKDEAPELVRQIEDEAIAVGSETGYAAGITAERERVLEILGAEADPAQTMIAITDGTEANAAFKAFYEAEKAKRAAGLVEMAEAAPEPAGIEEPADISEPEPKTPAEQRQAWRPVNGPAA